MEDFQRIIKRIKEFRDARDWEQFHNSKDLALAISIEASELLELYLWKGSEDAQDSKLKEEIADILIYTFLLAEKHDFDISELIESKIKQNEQKYPVEKSKGNAKKYTEL